MNPTIQNARPPYVRFEIRPVEDRNATLENGVFTTKDVIFALVTPSGSRDVVEKIAVEWLEQMAQFVREERFPLQWLEYYKAQFKAFVDNQEAPLDGTDLRTWRVLAPSQLTTLLQMNLRTVEDVANMNAEAIARYGMGGHDLKEQAQNYLDNNDAKTAQLTKELEDLRAQLAALQAAAQAQAAEPTVKEAGAVQPSDPAAARAQARARTAP